MKPYQTYDIPILYVYSHVIIHYIKLYPYGALGIPLHPPSFC